MASGLFALEHDGVHPNRIEFSDDGSSSASGSAFMIRGIARLRMISPCAQRPGDEEPVPRHRLPPPRMTSDSTATIDAVMVEKST